MLVANVDRRNHEPYLYRWLIVIGGLLCFAAMWLPWFDEFTPMHSDQAVVTWLAMLVPALGLPGTATGRRVVHILTRIVLIGFGVVGTFAVLLLVGLGDLDPVVLVVLLPAPLGLLLVGCLVRSLGNLIIWIGSGTLFVCLLLSGEVTHVGLAVLAAGAALLVVGGVLWPRPSKLDEAAPPLPRAVAL